MKNKIITNNIKKTTGLRVHFRYLISHQEKKNALFRHYKNVSNILKPFNLWPYRYFLHR